MEPTPPLMHTTYFVLVDNSEESCDQFMAACREYLAPEPGISGFWVGTLAKDQTRPVNDMKFDVAMYILFEDLEAYTNYQQSDGEKEFVKAVGNAASSRRVFDAYISE